MYSMSHSLRDYPNQMVGDALKMAEIVREYGIK
jgi:hypothetical protein